MKKKRMITVVASSVAAAIGAFVAGTIVHSWNVFAYNEEVRSKNRLADKYDELSDKYYELLKDYRILSEAASSVSGDYDLDDFFKEDNEDE